LKRIWIIAAIAGVIVLGAFLYLKFRKADDFEPLIKQKLQQAVRDASDSLYILDIDKIDVDVLASTIKVHNAKLLIDSARLKVLDATGKAPADVFKIAVSDIAVDGFSVDDLLKKKNIDLSLLNLKNPTVEIFHPVGKSNNKTKDTATLYARMAKSLGHFSIHDFNITNMNFKYHNITAKEKTTAFQNISMRFKDIEIDSTTQYDTTRFLYAKQAYIYLTDYSFRTADSLYFINADSLTVHTNQKSIDIKNLAVKPRYDKQGFSKQLTFYKDRYDVKFSTASFKNIDWYHFFMGEGFAASKGELSNGEMEVYANKYLAQSGKSKVGNYPHQLLMKLDFPTDVDTILVKNFKLTYRELNPKAKKEGYIVFDNINATILNITNIREKIASNKKLTVTATSRLMSADLTKTTNGNFSVDANLGAMNGTALNPAAVPLGLFEINSLNLKNLKVHINATNTNGNGTVAMVYDKLNITALKKEEDSKQLKQRKFLSFLANTFIVNKENKTGEAKPQAASFQRDPERSFFYLIWKTILEGIKKNVS
jgi:hypothetical protein